ncbi:hypothetical protein MUP79_08320 [Candidatus Bathyarchaeota archaeon]|nr:hypothetical protein [Candidatus Bathyarchaeota archaeon]
MTGSAHAGRTLVDAFNAFYYSWPPQRGPSDEKKQPDQSDIKVTVPG